MTADHIIVHDTRLAGQVFQHADITLIETHCETIARIATRVNHATHARPSRSVPVLSFFAHGVTLVGEDTDWAMQLGLEYVHMENAFQFGQSIRGCVTDRIRILACKAAASPNGMKICQRISDGAGVQVYASNTNQDYDFQHDRPQFLQREWGPRHPRVGWINFQRWEGQVYQFSPGARRGVPIFEGPAPRPRVRGHAGPSICS
jgi:hypothetical protein